MQAAAAGRISAEALEALYDDAVRDTMQRFEATGSPVVTDGEQRKPSFATYPIAGLADARAGRRRDPVRGRPHAAAAGADRRGRSATRRTRATYLEQARSARARAAQAGGDLRVGDQPHLPGATGSPGYPREAFLDDLVAEAERTSAAASSRARTRPDRLHRGAARREARPDRRGSCGASSTSTTRVARSLRRRSGRGSASTPAPAATTTRRTARTSTTPSCSRRLFALDAGPSTSQLASETRPRRRAPRRSPSTLDPASGSSSA